METVPNCATEVACSLETTRILLPLVQSNNYEPVTVAVAPKNDGVATGSGEEFDKFSLFVVFIILGTAKI